MKSIFAAAALAAVAVAEPLGPHEIAFMKYIAKWNKSYATREEFVARMKNWIRAEVHIREVNAPGSEHTHTAGHNHTSDWTEEEYERMLGAIPTPEHVKENAQLHAVAGDYVPNGSKDWRDGSCVTAVKDQGQCGSCWSFSGTESIESGACIHAGKGLKTLAPQQNVDCNTACYGCNGGWANQVFIYAESSAIENESAYPYTGVDGTCKYSASKGQVNTKSWTQVGSNNSAMMSALDGQPVSVAINASAIGFQFYQSGVFSGNCSTSPNHAVQAVGYNTSQAYWIVRNSWGSSWGNAGYIWMTQNGGSKGQCGINTDVNYPTF